MMEDKSVTSTDELIKKVFYNHFYSQHCLKQLISEVEVLKKFIDESKEEYEDIIEVDGFFDLVDEFHIDPILKKLNDAVRYSNDNTEHLILLSMEANRILGV